MSESKTNLSAGANPAQRPLPTQITPSKKSTDDIGLGVAAQLRHHRIRLGYSVDDLAKRSKLTAHSIRRLESGAGRIGAAQLFRLAYALDVDVNAFFDGLKGAQIVELIAEAPENERERAQLIRNFCQITNSDARRKISDIVRSVANSKKNTLSVD